MYTEGDKVPHTIAEMDFEMLTEARKRAWVYILNAKVERVYQGFLRIADGTVRGNIQLAGCICQYA